MMKIGPASGFGLSMLSDGVATSFSFDMALRPININFNGKLPVSVDVQSIGGGPAAPYFPSSVVLSGTTVTVTLSSPLPATDPGGIPYGYSFGVAYYFEA